MTAGRQHIVGLDLLRLLAAALVMFYHFCFWHWTRGQAFDAMQIPLPRGALTNVIGFESVFHFGWVGVEIFFVISGFVIAWSAVGASAESFLRSRFLRLAPVNIIVATLYYVYLEASGAQGDRSLTLLFLKTLVFWPFGAIDNVWWTLGIEIDFYLLVLLLIKLDKLEILENVMILIALMSGVFWIVTMSINGIPSSEGTFLSSFQWLSSKLQGNRVLQLLLVQHGCLFALGVLMWKSVNHGLSPRRIVAIGAVAGCCLLEIVAENGIIARASGLTLSPLPAIACWLGFLVLFSLSAFYNSQIFAFLKNRAGLMRTVGALTYPLYLVHNLVGGIIVYFLLPSLGAVSVPIAILSSILVAWLITVGPEPKLRAALRTGWRKALHEPEGRMS